MKWPEALLKPTREYSGGIIAGVGLGLLVAEMIARKSEGNIPWVLTFLIGFALIAVGSNLARSGQQAKQQNE